MGHSLRPGNAIGWDKVCLMVWVNEILTLFTRKRSLNILIPRRLLNLLLTDLSSLYVVFCPLILVNETTLKGYFFI